MKILIGSRMRCESPFAAVAQLVERKLPKLGEARTSGSQGQDVRLAHRVTKPNAAGWTPDDCAVDGPSAPLVHRHKFGICSGFGS